MPTRQNPTDFGTTRFDFAIPSGAGAIIFSLALLGFEFGFDFGNFLFAWRRFFWVLFKFSNQGGFLFIFPFFEFFFREREIGVVFSWRPVDGRVPAKLLLLLLLAASGKWAILFLLRSKVFRLGRRRYVCLTLFLFTFFWLFFCYFSGLWAVINFSLYCYLVFIIYLFFRFWTCSRLYAKFRVCSFWNFWVDLVNNCLLYFLFLWW